MKKYNIQLIGVHQELKNHVPKNSVFLYHPQLNNVVLLGHLYYKVHEIILFGDDDQRLPLLLVKFIENQPEFDI